MFSTARPHMRAAWLGTCAALLAAGCAQQPKVKPQPFSAKPEETPRPSRAWPELIDLYEQRASSEARAEQWKSLVTAGPEFARSLYVDERPVPATSWYEYMRSGRDLTTQVDRVMVQAYRSLAAQSKVEDNSAALRQLVAGTAAFELGLYTKARLHFRSAAEWMERVTNTELEKKAAGGRSDIKIYKGDSYERTMVHFYLGLIAFQQEDYQEAKQEFHRALLAHQSRPDPASRGQFALLHYWLGRSYARLGDMGNARAAVYQAKASGPAPQFAPLLTVEALQKNSLIILIQIGAGASLVPEGNDWQITKYQKTTYPESACEVFVSGKHMGSAILVADLWQQVSTQGQSEEQKLQQSKAVTKSIIQGLPYVNLIGVAWDVTGDMRSWSVLPDRLLMWTGEPPPGEYTITVKFYDAQNFELTRYRQTWYFVPVFEGRDSLLVLRSARNKCDMGGKEGQR